MTMCSNCGANHRRITSTECQDRSMTEAQLQSRVVYRAKKFGWKVAHAGRAWVGGVETGKWVTPMSPGWPDLMLFCPQHSEYKVLAIELKRELGKLEDVQIDWLQTMNACGLPAIVIRPSDLRDGAVDAILKVP